MRSWARWRPLTVLAQVDIFGRTWDLHSMIAGSLLMIVGVQVLALGLCAHAYGMYFMGERDPWFERMRARFRLEHGLLARRRPSVSPGSSSRGVIVGIWIDRGFGDLAEERLAVSPPRSSSSGIQVFFSSFLLSILGLRRRD